MEEWRKIPGWDNLSVSSCGRIRNDKTGRYLKLSSERGNYKKVTFHKDGKCYRISVHRAVCMAFIPNPEGKETVNHKNGIHDDNRVSNLEWATQRENNIHKYEVLGFRMSPEGRNSIRQKRKKKVIRLEDGKVYDSLTEAAEDVGVVISNISLAIKGVHHTAGGYHWDYFSIAEPMIEEET